MSFEYTDAYKSGNPEYDGRFVGFIAQEIEEVFPGMVTTTSEAIGDEIVDDFRLLQQGDLVPFLVDAVIELKEQQDALRAQNESLIAQLQALK